MIWGYYKPVYFYLISLGLMWMRQFAEMDVKS